MMLCGLGARASHVKFLESLWPCERIRLGEKDGTLELSLAAIDSIRCMAK